MKIIYPAALAVLAGLVLTFAPVAQARVVGSGHSATETRNVSDFEAITSDGSMDLEVRQTGKEAVEVQADDNLLPLIETVVEPGSNGRTLVIRFKRGESISHHSSIKVRIDVVKLNSISTSGSGDVAVESLKTPSFKLAISGSSDAKLNALATDAFELRISGSGDVVGSGNARQVKVSIAGSGDADLDALVADDVTVRIAGSGDASVNANKALDVSIAGSGDVTYRGNPASLKTSTAGSGSISRR